MASALVPRPVLAALALVALWLVGFQAHVLLPSHPGAETIFNEWSVIAVQLVCAALCLERARRSVAHERKAWALIGAGVAVWTLASVYWATALHGVNIPPVPSPADAGYLLYVPLVLGGIVLLMRGRLVAVPRTVLADALTAMLAAGTVCATFVVQPVTASVEGDVWAVAINLAYPVFDLVLLGVVVGAVAMSGWRLDWTWTLLGAGIVAFWTADTLYLIATANGTYVTPSVFDVGWPASALLFAAAAWRAPSRRLPAPRSTRLRQIVIPLGLASVALLLIAVEPASSTRLPTLILGVSCLLTVMVRLVMTFQENLTLLHSTQTHAYTDVLTGLGNRRALMEALEAQLPVAGDARPAVLALFDLDGFKSYNDSFGHPAGDALLKHLGERLAHSVAGRGDAYRMGGDEFCVLIRLGEEAARPVIDGAGAALSDRGKGFSIGCSYGSLVLPRDANDVENALRVVDQRMYAAKTNGRRSAGRQSEDVLMKAQCEHDPQLGLHVHGVAKLAEAVAMRLGLIPAEAEQVRRAAELHDIGKVAVPDTILEKPGPLNEADWEIMRTHTLIGERIIAAAPDLGEVATIVRSTHERFGGGGYPDGLRGTAIPIGARIVTVCDAFAAMITDRSYQRAVTTRAAIAELRRCAGTQFDPAAVEAFCSEWRAREPDGPSLPRISVPTAGTKRPTRAA